MTQLTRGHYSYPQGVRLVQACLDCIGIYVLPCLVTISLDGGIDVLELLHGVAVTGTGSGTGSVVTGSGSGVAGSAGVVSASGVEVAGVLSLSSLLVSFSPFSSSSSSSRVISFPSIFLR